MTTETVLRIGIAHNGETIDGNGEEIDRIIFSPACHDVTVCNYTARKAFITGRNNTLRNNNFYESDDVGIYVGAYSERITLEGNKVVDSCGAGVYLDHHSHNHIIRHNQILGCGHRQIVAGLLLPRLGWNKRSGIAVDSSQSNLIEHNLLADNGLAGIAQPIEVWVKAREWRDMVTWDCARQGRWVPLWKVPKQPIQQWWNWSCLAWMLGDGPIRSPIRWRIWKVDDEASVVGDSEVEG